MKKNFFKRTVAIISAVALSISVPMTADYYNIAAADNNVATPTDAIQNEFTTAPITLKVGETFPLLSTDIDQLISNEIAETNKGLDYVYWVGSPNDNNAIIDENYLAAVYCYELLDANTYESLYTGYGTATEMEELAKQYLEGNLKYDGKDATFVETGSPYYVRAEQTGNTTITIPAYRVGEYSNNITIEVKIPVIIEEADIVVPDIPTGGNTSDDNTITSNTDSTITINAGSILSAGTSLTSANVESGDIFEAAKKLVTDKLENIVKYAVYELNLTAADNSEIHELAGKVKVTMNVPFEMSDGSTLKIFRVDDDVLTECASTITNGKVTFETDHFSTYILAEQNTNSAPDTGDINNIGLYIVLMGACTATIAILTYRKRVNA